MAVALIAVLVLGAVFGTGTGRADPAPEQWQPAPGDTARTVRPCPIQVAGPVQPVCWSMTEDAAAWMAQPPGSPYPWGQCTYYVGVMRPDIWNDRAPPSVDPLNDWDAWTWVVHAQAEGLAVDGDPQPGDVMVYSRAAVDNATGHVAIVDGVDGVDASTGDLQITVSEMNVEGLDDASQGQGDTSVVLVPRSQLVPGMIQFIHQPGPGYTPPAWPAGSGGGGGPAGAPVAQDPSLALAFTGTSLEALTRSPAPLQTTVTVAATGAPAAQLTVAANRSTPLALAPGTYRVCVSQVASGPWAAAAACAIGTWPAPRAPTLQVGRPRHAGGHITIPLSLNGRPGTGAVIAAASTATAAATVQVTLHAVQRSRSGRRVRSTIAYRTAVTLRPGRQVLRLRIPRHRRLLRGTTLAIVIVAHGAPGVTARVALALG